jgi:formyltetrahydrofolate-dependent phosphoribosylglycinamide formyltransferase
MSPRPPFQIAVLLSGNGTSLENLFEHMDRGDVPGEVAVVIASKEKAFGLERARQRGVPAIAVPRAKYKDIGSFNDALHEALEGYAVDLVALLGFLSLFELRGQYEGRVLNVHPALIPAFSGQGFYGQKVHEAVLASGVKITGATVHFVNEQYDRGPILAQEAVPVAENDSAQTLAARVQEAERRLVPRAIRWIAEGRVRIEDGRTRVQLPEKDPSQGA